MESISGPEFLALQHQPQSYCKQHGFIFTDISDIDLPSEVHKFDYTETMKTEFFHPFESDNLSTISSKKNFTVRNRRSNKYKFLIAFVGILLVSLFGFSLPFLIQLRSSSLLEARLTFIRRLLKEAPLIEANWAAQEPDITASLQGEPKENLVGAILLPVSIPCGAQYLDAVQLALEGLDRSKRAITNNYSLRLVYNAEAMEGAHAEQLTGVLLGLNGGHVIGSSLAVLRNMYELGIRFVSLTRENCGTPWASALIESDHLHVDANQTETLTNFGIKVLHEMNRLGVLVEVSHLSEQSMWRAFEMTKSPLLILNASPKIICNSTNKDVISVSNDILRLLSQNGGVIMLNMDKCGDKILDIHEAINIINYVRSITGVDHLGISSSTQNIAQLLAELARDRAWNNAAIKKLIGGNIVRILKEAEAFKNRIPLLEDWIPASTLEPNAYCMYPET